MHVIDRRLNPGGKSLANRQRFIRRARALVRRAVREASGGRSIKDIDKGGEVTISTDGVREPTLRRSSEGGVRDYVLPGNKEYDENDKIARPPQGGGSGSEGSEDGEGEDEFRFALSNEEFLDLFLEDLELPDLAKRQMKGVSVVQWRRAGYSVSGPPASLSIQRTMRNSLSRRLALRRPSIKERDEIQAEIEALEKSGKDAARLAQLHETLAKMNQKAKRIPFIDPIDVRYRRLEATPKPIAQAVMFCLMDVSGSMTEHMKDLAKRFYALLYLFLKRRYKHVEVVFIRHTHEAAEVDEETFFYSRETGGTVVSTALEEMLKIAAARFPATEWNIYGAQASDGDNAPSDNSKSAALLANDVLPLCQYYAYLEVGADDEPGGNERPTTLWRTYQVINGPDKPIAMRKVRHRRDIYPVFRDLFQRKANIATENA
jgi:hypothetical protein